MMDNLNVFTGTSKIYLVSLAEGKYLCADTSQFAQSKALATPVQFYPSLSRFVRVTNVVSFLLLLAQVELLELLLGQLLHAGGGDEPVLVLGRDELQVAEVGRRFLLLVLGEAEADADLVDGQVGFGDDRRGDGDHDGRRLAVVAHVVYRGHARGASVGCTQFVKSSTYS